MNTIPQSADVVVIGGGPAGSTAANLLAQKGYNVVLFDQERHPRPVVGESILPHFWKYAEQLDVLDEIEAAGFLLKAGGLTIWNGEIRQMRLSDFGFTKPGMHVERDVFDDILLRGAEKKGVQVFEEVKVREVHLDDPENRSVVYVDKSSGEKGQITCRYIVDASGQAAVIANQLKFREFDPDLRFMCVWGYYENSDYIGYGGTIHPFENRWNSDTRPMTFASGIGDWGWCWHLVQKELTSVGLVLAPKEAAEFKAGGGTLEERFVRGIESTTITSKLLEPATLVPDSLRGIRDFAYRPTQLCGDGWYLAGDASAFVDPINSAGVAVSLYTGYLSAWSIAASFEKPQKAAYYSKLFDSLVRQRLSLYRISALPEGVNSYAEEDYPLALQAAQFEKNSEQELLLVQTYLTHRRENLSRLYEMDNRIKYDETDLYETLPYLTAADGSPWYINQPDVVAA